MKYIIVNKEGIESAVLFSEQLQHNEVSAFSYERVAAGFYRPSVGVWGKSVSLGLRSREKDLEIINESINFDTHKALD